MRAINRRRPSTGGAWSPNHRMGSGTSDEFGKTRQSDLPADPLQMLSNTKAEHNPLEPPALAGQSPLPAFEPSAGAKPGIYNPTFSSHSPSQQMVSLNHHQPLLTISEACTLLAQHLFLDKSAGPETTSIYSYTPFSLSHLPPADHSKYIPPHKRCFFPTTQLTSPINQQKTNMPLPSLHWSFNLPGNFQNVRCNNQVNSPPFNPMLLVTSGKKRKADDAEHPRPCKARQVFEIAQDILWTLGLNYVATPTPRMLPAPPDSGLPTSASSTVACPVTTLALSSIPTDATITIPAVETGQNTRDTLRRTYRHFLTQARTKLSRAEKGKQKVTNETPSTAAVQELEDDNDTAVVAGLQPRTAP